jgi:hypothetical protein
MNFMVPPIDSGFCYRGRKADEPQTIFVLRRQALPIEFRELRQVLTQAASASGRQPARKMVDAV